ncbi:uncharacterized protein [Excalfactoria chinensis]|uniref:uncharacterized protein n=1 Tax=Excalfactoria chinensis TaxID=46218 RepID=UPI003B3A33FA
MLGKDAWFLDKETFPFLSLHSPHGADPLVLSASGPSDWWPGGLGPALAVRSGPRFFSRAQLPAGAGLRRKTLGPGRQRHGRRCPFFPRGRPGAARRREDASGRRGRRRGEGPGGVGEFPARPPPPRPKRSAVVCETQDGGAAVSGGGGRAARAEAVRRRQRFSSGKMECFHGRCLRPIRKQITLHSDSSFEKSMEILSENVNRRHFGRQLAKPKSDPKKEYKEERW